MKIPISPNVLHYDSPVYKEIKSDIVNKGHQVISISGPRNCSKTFFEILLLFLLHESIPNLVSVVCMLEYTNISKTFIPTIKEIIPYSLKDPKLPWTFKGGENRPEAIEFNNGGKMHFLGVSESGRKVRGLAADVVLYGQIEAEQTDISFREIMGTQAGGRKGNLKLKGIDTFLFIGDCNPQSKQHWWYKQKENGTIDGWYDIKHVDHPLFYDWTKKEWREKGIRTRNDLERLYPKGYMYDRYVDGKWTSAEGACFTEFSEKDHIKLLQIGEYTPRTKWYVSIDFGNVSAMGLYAETENKEVHLFKEYYRSDPSPTLIVEQIREWESEYNIRLQKVITDIETGNRAILKEAGYNPKVANKTVPITEGIQLVQKAFKENKLFINSDSLEYRDPLLEGSPQCLIEELPEIHYPPKDKRTGTKKDDKPSQSCIRHAADHMRYMIVEIFKRIELPRFFK